MACFFDHDWSWPRRRGRKDMQVCLKCGLERESLVRFDGPRYRRTQEPMPEVGTAELNVVPARRRPQIVAA